MSQLSATVLQKFACAVVSQRGQHLLIDTGSLPEAVAASAAVPFFFTGVDIPGEHKIITGRLSCAHLHAMACAVPKCMLLRSACTPHVLHINSICVL